MTPYAAQRQIVLAGIALLAVVVVLVLASLAGGEDGAEAERRPVAAPGATWYTALAAPYTIDAAEERTACGYAAEPGLHGIAHPVLPCGARIVVSFEGTDVLTAIVDRGTGQPGREFDVTAPLANRLGLEGVREIRWRFAAPEEEPEE